MAKILPVRGTWPGPQPIGRLEPGCQHFQSDVEQVVEGQHYCCCYQGRGHFGQILGRHLVEVTSAVYVVVGEWLCMPRHHCTGLKVPLKVDSDGGGTVKVEGTRTSDGGTVTATIHFAAGPQWLEADLPAMNGQDQIVTVSVRLKIDSPGGSWCSLEAISCSDTDLSAVP